MHLQFCIRSEVGFGISNAQGTNIAGAYKKGSMAKLLAGTLTTTRRKSRQRNTSQHRQVGFHVALKWIWEQIHSLEEMDKDNFQIHWGNGICVCACACVQKNTMRSKIFIFYYYHSPTRSLKESYHCRSSSLQSTNMLCKVVKYKHT